MKSMAYGDKFLFRKPVRKVTENYNHWKPLILSLLSVFSTVFQGYSYLNLKVVAFFFWNIEVVDYDRDD